MKAVILAGGYGTRISEESKLKPKPMIEIGGKPILWHILKYYSFFGLNDFIICCGYKQHIIKDFFADYYRNMSDITFDLTAKNKMTVHNNYTEPWRVTLVDTGLETMTGGRIKRVKDYIGDETFMLTYGDGISDVNITQLSGFHKSHGKIATITAVKPDGRFGMLDIDDKDEIISFKEKTKEEAGWINGGFMVLEPKVFDYIDGDKTVLEKEPLERIAAEGQLKAFRHYGFWQCMDTVRDRELLEKIWAGGDALWKVWE
ncbi:glucose-1-phosphate cytidylyltransferase [Ruminiclostridium sufflavum DSM 19573]|uniref:Glucose-1-phosphate cytidylyltransferase n=1 Tax=Ruminiclostridium sufflavum DSM 19573 TaxID=1121337 RepID=A0A318XM61_9FIRM|nr:glucose-1-phosphate cytidylyltransferase [Ruminiclostridium sufflavum]PYG87792.1 glucose-1-phosphate cytidylyltransferase [Ruminiclostridium sufflavum DSM 19573]